MTKVCGICKKEKDRDKNFLSFYQKGKKENYKKVKVWDSYCKDCRNLVNSLLRRIAKKQCVDFFNNKCYDCGIVDESQEVYDFHHLDPAEKDFSISGGYKSFEKLKKELSKCIMLCANCHRKRHSALLSKTLQDFSQIYESVKAENKVKIEKNKISTINCLKCELAFKPRDKKTKFCSVQCYKEYRTK